MIEALVITNDNGRVVCSYFPPHVVFKVGMLENHDNDLDRYIMRWSNLTFYPGEFQATELLTIQCDNGGAEYLIAAEVDGLREAKLWKLIPGLEPQIPEGIEVAKA